MRFKTIAFALIVSSAVFILGCDDEDSSTIGGGGRLYYEVTVNPPLDSHTVQAGSGVYSGSTGDNFTPATGFTTNEFDVPKGVDVPVFVLIQRTSPVAPYPPAKCTNIRVKAILNGSVFDDRTFNMGHHFYILTPHPCPDSTAQTYNLIIP